MDTLALLSRFDRLPVALDALLEGLPLSDWRWRPPQGGWSLVEIVNHLVDEEVEDFRIRVQLMLEDPEKPWPALDPEGIVTERKYQERDPVDSLRRFREERTRSVAWFAGALKAPWENSRMHARVGRIHAGDLLASWLAHDARHLEQISKRLYALAIRDGHPYSVKYAG